MKQDKYGLEKYAVETVPTKDWVFTHLLDDIIMVKYVDTDKEGNIKRGSIYVPTDATRQVWRVGEIVMAGDKCPDYIKPGVKVMFPSDRGIPSVTRDGTELHFLNVDRIFGIVESANDDNNN